MLIKYSCEVAGCSSVINGKQGYRKHVIRSHKNIDVPDLLDKIKKIHVPEPELDKSKLPFVHEENT